MGTEENFDIENNDVKVTDLNVKAVRFMVLHQLEMIEDDKCFCYYHPDALVINNDRIDLNDAITSNGVYFSSDDINNYSNTISKFYSRVNKQETEITDGVKKTVVRSLDSSDFANFENDEIKVSTVLDFELQDYISEQDDYILDGVFSFMARPTQACKHAFHTRNFKKTDVNGKRALAFYQIAYITHKFRMEIKNNNPVIEKLKKLVFELLVMCYYYAEISRLEDGERVSTMNDLIEIQKRLLLDLLPQPRPQTGGWVNPNTFTSEEPSREKLEEILGFHNSKKHKIIQRKAGKTHTNVTTVNHFLFDTAINYGLDDHPDVMAFIDPLHKSGVKHLNSAKEIEKSGPGEGTGGNRPSGRSSKLATAAALAVVTGIAALVPR